MERHIVAYGGGGGTEELTRRLFGFAFDLAGKERPRVGFVPTAVGDAAESIVSFYERYAELGEISHLTFFPWPPRDLREWALSRDVLVISGGNTANMLALWRLHGFDGIVREAWEAGVVLCGQSAGMICWFEAGVTDSFGPDLDGMRDGLGFLAGSACPHYDGEALRRPRYRELVDGGFPPGLAADDGVGLHFAGEELVEVVTVRDGAGAYRVEPGSQTPLAARSI
jgi:peptidase E